MSTIAKPNPFAALIAAAAAKPAATGEVAHYERRIASGGTGLVVIADVSASMAGPAGSRTKIEVLREALATAPPARLIAFSSSPCEVAGPAALPAPAGGTALHLALDLAATVRPARTLVVSDGQPDSEDAALAAAEGLPGIIDCIFCGPDSDLAARAFLRRLARAGGGRYAGHDIGRFPTALGPAVRTMLLGAGRP